MAEDGGKDGDPKKIVSFSQGKRRSPLPPASGKEAEVVWNRFAGSAKPTGGVQDAWTQQISSKPTVAQDGAPKPSPVQIAEATRKALTEGNIRLYVGNTQIKPQSISAFFETSIDSTIRFEGSKDLYDLIDEAWTMLTHTVEDKIYPEKAVPRYARMDEERLCDAYKGLDKTLGDHAIAGHIAALKEAAEKFVEGHPQWAKFASRHSSPERS